ncbi:receptor kinase TMK1-like [Olea europaea subsp. europaea]|uniref:Receptor kinase TMK1-like, partial n=1 Tax=Olea europaea subsp. europaea TaxID=158383 RepID=A0A8S0SQI8_OLEEU|nr:receptor kinase TMK1-like [Olea europaea subsp. europaea]
MVQRISATCCQKTYVQHSNRGISLLWLNQLPPLPLTSPTPVPPGGAPKHAPKTNGKGKKIKSKVYITVGSVVGGLALLVLLGLLESWLRKYMHRRRIQQMERATDIGEILHMTTVGTAKAPVATVTRTQPTIETEYVP